MNIGLDYDDTFTRDPDAWQMFVAMMDSHGHNVYIVTWRDEEEGRDMSLNLTVRKYLSGIYCTARQAKETFMYAQGIRIDVWVDDNPRAILHSMEKL